MKPHLELEAKEAQRKLWQFVSYNKDYDAPGVMILREATYENLLVHEEPIFRVKWIEDEEETRR